MMDERQGGLFDDSSLIQPELSKAVTDDAIYRATFLTSEERKQAYYEAVESAARQHQYFTADQIWEVLGEVGDGERDNGSGMGPVIRTALAAGVMKASGASRRSQRPPMHGKLIPVYESLLWTGVKQ